MIQQWTIQIVSVLFVKEYIFCAHNGRFQKWKNICVNITSEIKNNLNLMQDFSVSQSGIFKLMGSWC